MADFILTDGDMANFQPAFGAAIVTVIPGKITGSGPGTIGGKKICVEGDESSVQVSGCMYIAGKYTIPGNGTLTISALGGDQKASKTKSGGTAVLLKGSTFTAEFAVDSPAQFILPAPPGGTEPDPTPKYANGKGSFITTNTKFKGA